MSCYSFHIFDRHTECIYSKRWTQPPQQRPAAFGNGDNSNIPSAARRALKAEDDAKLIFGTIFSLRRMVRQLGGQDDQFLCYRTGEYKLHYFETPTQLKFVMLTDTRVGNMRTVLYQIWATLYVEYVVKSPTVPIEHPKGVGVANELFEGGLEGFIVSPSAVSSIWTFSNCRRRRYSHSSNDWSYRPASIILSCTASTREFTFGRKGRRSVAPRAKQLRATKAYDNSAGHILHLGTHDVTKHRKKK